MATLRLGELLKAKGLISDVQMEVAMSQQAITGSLLGDTLSNLGFVSTLEIARILAEQAGIEFTNLEEYVPSEEALRLVSRDVAENTGFLPLNLEDGILSIGIINASNVLAIDTAGSLSGRPPKVFMVDAERFYETLAKAYYFLENPVQKRIEAAINEIKVSAALSAAQVANFAELLIMDGIRRKATDIHITPAPDAVHVFYRIDGVLQHGYCFSKNAHNGAVSRVKILSKMDIAEQRLPQDGAFSYVFLNKNYGLRVSIIPTIYGENVAIRILGSAISLLSISVLGFDEHDTKRLRLLFSKPYGIILITGPTGSGKTTTLYSALREVNLLEKNVLTVEDPVEYKLSMAKQTEVNLKAGYDFAVAGRNFMRQDPDVMLLGEIRDEETAKIALRASVTGHLVLTTLHTNDAATAIPRLIDLEVDKYTLSSALLAIVAQRLVRKVCRNCIAEHQLAAEELSAMGYPELEGKVKSVFKGKGCRACNGTGYLGRVALGEILIVDDNIKELIYSGASVNAIKAAAALNGMKTMKDDGIRKALAGVTTFEEVERVTG